MQEQTKAQMHEWINIWSRVVVVNRKVQDITANIAYFGPLLSTFIIMTTKFRHLKLVCVQKVSIKLVSLPVMLNRLQQALLMLGKLR